MREHPRIRKAMKWTWRGMVTAGPVVIPCALMGVFVVAASIAVGPIAFFGIAFACVPYLALGGLGLVAVRFRRLAAGWLLAVLPALLLATVHAVGIAEHLEALRNPPLSPSGGEFSIRPEAVTAIAFVAVSVLALVVIASCWAMLGFWILLRHRRVRAGHCSQCRYDRAGIPPSAVCPECGAVEKSAADARG